MAQQHFPIKLNIAQAQMIYTVHRSLWKIIEQISFLEYQIAFINFGDINSLK